MFVLSLLVHTAYLFHHYNIFIISKSSIGIFFSGVSSLHTQKSDLKCCIKKKINKMAAPCRCFLRTEVTVFTVLASDLSLLAFNAL